MEPKSAILIVDDDANLASNLQHILELEGYQAVVAHDGQMALTLCREMAFALGIIDIRLPDMSGVELIGKLAELSPMMGYLISTGYASLETAIDAVGQGRVVAYETKPLNMDHILSLIRQVTERQQAEEALAAQKELTDRVLASTPNAILVVDGDLEIMLANRAFYEIFNMKRGEAEDRQVGDVLPIAGLNEAISRTLAERSPQLDLEFRYETESGEMILVAQIVPMAGEEVLLILRDVTAESAREAQLHYIDRLASIGEVAAGVAHELNNPLASVVGYSELVLAGEIPQEVKSDVAVIHNNAQRAATIVRNLLAFARRQEPQQQCLSVNDLLRHVLEMRGYELKVGNIEVITELADELPNVLADPQQLEQVFLNIILNAEQAMLEAHNGGALAVRTETRRDLVRITFSDDGPGIPEENLRRVFNPFFTTKAPGKGTGLGLSICHGIVTQHNGRIYAESKVGEGATFFVELPLAEEEEVHRATS